MVTIYILKLKNDKWYVGRTRNLQKRLEQHENGKGSYWVIKHGYLEITETFVGDAFDEDKTVLSYMEQYGIDNVRGGIYSNTFLTFDQTMNIKKHIRGAKDLCLACGLEGHFILQCKTVICYRCGRNGHISSDCKETDHIHNGSLSGCYRCGRESHWAVRCNRTCDVYGRILPKGIVRGLLSFIGF